MSYSVIDGLVFFCPILSQIARIFEHIVWITIIR